MDGGPHTDLPTSCPPSPTDPSPFLTPAALPPISVYPLPTFIHSTSVCMPLSPTVSVSVVPTLVPSKLQKDLGYLQQWLKAFVGTFEKSISLSSLEPRR